MPKLGLIPINCFKTLKNPKKLLALTIIILNTITTYKIAQREAKWFKAHRQVWPVLTKEWKIGSEIPSLKEMVFEEQLRFNASLKNNGNNFHLVNSVFNEEHVILANSKQVDSLRESLLRKKARVLDRLEKNRLLEVGGGGETEEEGKLEKT